MLPVIAAIKSVAADGWSLQAAAYGVAGLIVGAGFVVRQLRASVPMVDLRLVAQRRFGGSLAVNVLAMFAIMGNSLVLTQYLQSVLGLAPLAAALWSLAPSLVVAVAAPLAAHLSSSLGGPRVMAGGFAISVIGFLLLSRVEVGSPLGYVLAAAALVSGGLVAVLSLITDYLLGVAPADHAGSIAGLTETSSELGGALGMAILGSVLTAGYRTAVLPLLPSSLDVELADQARQTMAGAAAVATTQPGAVGEALLAAGRSAYVSGMHTTSLAAAAVLVVAAILTSTLDHRSAPVRDQPGEEAFAPEAVGDGVVGH